MIDGHHAVHCHRLAPHAIGGSAAAMGHGRAGNGSGNLLNGLAISGQDDWDGSAGKFWDVDLFKPYPHTKYIAEEEDLTLTVDPLLQWLYPIGVIIKSWSTE